jgi:membrane-bound inhibitor of C-type lysozyme
MEVLPLAAAAMLGNVDVSAQVVLSLNGNFERNTVQYHCEGMEPFSVSYINADPNFIALVPVNGETLIFVSVVAASGVKYVSGAHEFWTKGSEATLTDTMAETPTPVQCSEVTETP